MRDQTALSRRTALASIGSVAALTALSGCLGSDDEGTITISGPGGGWGENREEAQLDPFNNNEEPWGDHDWEIEYETVETMQRWGEIEANPDDPPWDMTEVDQTTASRWNERDLMVDVSEVVDNYENISPAFREPYLPGSVVTLTGIAYNENHVEAEPTSWEDLYNDDFEGRIGIPEWGWQGDDFLYIVNHAMGGTLDDLDPGFEFIEELLELDPVMLTDANHAEDMLQQEEIYVGFLPNGRTENVRINTEGDVPTTFVIPEDGAVTSVWDYGALQNRPEERLDGVVTFLEGLYEPEPQAHLAEIFGQIPTNPDAYPMIDDDIVEERPSLRLTDDDLQALEEVDIDWAQAAAQRDEDGDRWRQTVDV